MIIFPETNLLIGFTVLFSLIGFYVDFETVNLECLPDQLLIQNSTQLPNCFLVLSRDTGMKNARKYMNNLNKYICIFRSIFNILGERLLLSDIIK